MHKLTVLENLPRPDRARVAAHNHRRLGARVLISNEYGRWALLSEDEYRDYLGGINPGHRLWEELKTGGFLKHAVDFEAAASALRERSLFSWRGPDRHVLGLDRDGRMSPQTAIVVLDFIFTAPGHPLRIEMTAGEPESCRPVIGLIIDYARRRGEWKSRAVELSLRAPGRPWEKDFLAFLQGHQVALTAEISLAGGPQPSLLRNCPARRVLAAVETPGSDAAAWARVLAESGARSVKLWPGEKLWTPRGQRAFLGFYAQFLDNLLAGETGGLIEENAAAFLSGRRSELGLDVLSELGYGPKGEIYTSAAALSLRKDRELFRIGGAAQTRYSDLARHPAVKACLAGVLGDNQPLCFQCVYKSFCALPAAGNYRRQKTLWGQTPSSMLCALHMGMLDEIFSKMEDPAKAEAFSRWTGD